MDVISIILTGVISILAVGVGWHLNSQTSKDVQERQQRHELAMQEQRFQAERQNRQDEAIRVARRARLEPVMDLISEIEGAYAYRFWKQLCEQVSKDSTFDAALANAAADVFPEGVPPDIQTRILERMIEKVPRPSEDLLARTSTLVFRIGDDDLRRDLFYLVAGLPYVGQEFRSWSLKVADVHTRLERYAASID